MDHDCGLCKNHSCDEPRLGSGDDLTDEQIQVWIYFVRAFATYIHRLVSQLISLCEKQFASSKNPKSQNSQFCLSFLGNSLMGIQTIIWQGKLFEGKV